MPVDADGRGAAEPRVLVIGLGNLLAADEGLGPHAVRRLLERGMPDGVAAIDAGTDLLAVAAEMERAGRVILIDAIQTGGAPGTLYRWTLSELLERAALSPDVLSGHGLTLIGSLELVRAMGVRLPPTIIIGVEPASVEFATELTPIIEKALEALIEAVIAEAAD